MLAAPTVVAQLDRCFGLWLQSERWLHRMYGRLSDTCGGAHFNMRSGSKAPRRAPHGAKRLGISLRFLLLQL